MAKSLRVFSLRLVAGALQRGLVAARYGARLLPLRPKVWNIVPCFRYCIVSMSCERHRERKTQKPTKKPSPDEATFT